MHFNREFIKTIVPEALFYGVDFPPDASLVVDSRDLRPGELFVALKGGRVDGHDFIEEAISKGAVGLIISLDQKDCLRKIQAKTKDTLTIVCLPNVAKDIVTLATAWRAKFTYPVIGITGSVGKTTTKEMLAHILRKSGKNCLASSGNQNTLLGVSLNILKMNDQHTIAIFEMGISKRGEMAELAQLVRPTTAIITAIGHSHMEGLGSINDIASEKRDIFKFFKEDSIGIVNGDQPLLTMISYTHPIIKFGCKMTNQIQARKIQVQGAQTHFILKLYRERFRVSMPTNHMGPILNGLAACSAAYVVGVSPSSIVEGLKTIDTVARRFERRPIKARKGVLIDDSYNASPESMKAALLAFEKIEEKGQKIAVLGDMLELGVNAPFWHRQLGRFLRKVPSLQHVVLVGENVKWAQKTMPSYVTCQVVPNWKQALSCLKDKLERECVILVKGSRAMELENLVYEITE